ncbi:hypothetical protein BO78DRAFT_435073 [Aspergillus sclerotiicarbonarius CBS 121057]|uniref:SnoaL-like domain-containing protein n=1 Tax=Aspergillus sclerotiicarbonarius (strain CBS 121057 / IBT 28362) TaxID=1448318 RepID=A0A319EQE2_ASPSB|nr:hypothetical protein BO78DRAFT_435073 [Aspergillus sclerotiicarbonarius CBS 121057]
MPSTTTTLHGPFNPPSTIMTKLKTSPHPILTWYHKYVTDFTTSKTTTPATKYYASTATLTNPDNSIISGAQQIWDYYIEMYGRFERCGYEVISVMAVTDTDTDEGKREEKHTLIVECTTSLYLKGGGAGRKVSLPQAFVYEIGNAEEGEGKGEDGLQIWRLRVYFDKGLLMKAAGMEE